MIELDLQIGAVQKQISTEKARLTAPGGKTLNAAVEEFQRLQMEAQFAQEVYQTALTALERGRVEATRTLKKVSVLQSAGMPEFPLEPRRLYNLIVFVLTAFLLAGVLQLLQKSLQSLLLEERHFSAHRFDNGRKQRQPFDPLRLQ